MATQDATYGEGQIETEPDTVRFSYENELGNHRVQRVWAKVGNEIHATNREMGYSYTDREWRETHSFTYTYQLADDGETLVCEESHPSWDGHGRNWREYARKRHRELLESRFPNDDLEGIGDE